MARPTINLQDIDAMPEIGASIKTNEKVQEIAVNLIDPNPDQPRTLFNEADLLELAESINEHGVLQPVIVTPYTAESGEKRYYLVAGERRLRGAKLAKLPTIPCIVRTSAAQKRRVLALIENIQRSDMGAMDTALSIKAWMDEEGATQAIVAKKLGKSQGWVSQHLALLELPAQVQTAIHTGEISASTGRNLASKSGKRLESALKQAKAGEKVKASKDATNEIKKLIAKLNKLAKTNGIALGLDGNEVFIVTKAT